MRFERITRTTAARGARPETRQDSGAEGRRIEALTAPGRCGATAVSSGPAAIIVTDQLHNALRDPLHEIPRAAGEQQDIDGTQAIESTYILDLLYYQTPGDFAELSGGLPRIADLLWPVFERTIPPL